MKHWLKSFLAGTLLLTCIATPAGAYDMAFSQRVTTPLATSKIAVSEAGTVEAFGGYTLAFHDGSDLAGVISVSACGGDTGAAILEDGSLWTWGDNEYGSAGQNTNDYYCPARKIMTNVTSISAGSVNMVATRGDNTAWGWGSSIDSWTPKHLMSDVLAATASTYEDILLIKTDGSLWSYYKEDVVQIPNLQNVIGVCAGNNLYAAITSDHTLYVWKTNYDDYNSSILDAQRKSSPTPLMDNVASASASMDGLIILKTDGSVCLYREGKIKTIEIGFQKAVAVSSNNVSYSVLLEDGTVYQYDALRPETGGDVVCSNIRLPERLRTAPSSWAVAEVNLAKSRGLVPDSLDDRYQSPITRAEFAQLAVHLIEGVRRENIQQVILDEGKTIDYNAYYDCKDPNVAAVTTLGIVNGTGNGTFSPNKNISREQAATMLTRAANVLGLSVPNGNSVYFDDSAKISSWAMQGVVFISSCQTGPNRIMGGTAPSLFSPQGTYSREQAVVSVNRLYEILS